jgi:hypothetical protein
MQSSDVKGGDAMVMNGVRSQAVKHLLEKGFDVSAKVVAEDGVDEVDGVLVGGRPEVTLRVVPPPKYTYDMMQLNLQNGFGVRLGFHHEGDGGGENV